MSVLGYNRNEAVHLLKSYYLPSILYGCEIWSLRLSDCRRVNIVWINAFRKYCNAFNATGERIVSCLFFTIVEYCL